MSDNEQIDQELLRKTIGTAARAARKRLGFTQEDVAGRMDCSAEFYARIERGHAFPSVTTLNKIVDVLQVRADDLLGLTGELDEQASRALTRNRSLYDDLSPELRRLLGRLRLAAPGTLRLISSIAKELERTAREEASEDGDGGEEASEDGDGGEEASEDGDGGGDDAADESVVAADAAVVAADAAVVAADAAVVAADAAVVAADAPVVAADAPVAAAAPVVGADGGGDDARGESE